MDVKVHIIYDSLSGNTEKMARAIAEGASSVRGVDVEVDKIGQAFPLSKVSQADVVLFGSPVNYADITNGLRGFLDHLKRFIEDGRLEMRGKKAAIFGSYGYDGAWIFEDRLKRILRDMGYDVQEKVCVKTDNEVKYNESSTLADCRAYGKELAESIKK